MYWLPMLLILRNSWHRMAELEMIFIFIFKHFCNFPNVVTIGRKSIPSNIFNLLLFSSHFTPCEFCSLLFLTIILSYDFIT